MVKGMYNAASGMMLQLAKQDIVANNIANSHTHSFKRQLAIACSSPVMEITRLEGINSGNLGKLGSGALISEVCTDFSPGTIRQTGNPADLALAGEAYFVVETPRGERFTRNGSFKVNFDGLLCTSQGYPILDQNGDYIYVEPGFIVDRQGNLSVNGTTLHTLQLVTFDDPKSLVKDGENLYAAEAAHRLAEGPQLMQGYLEESNVNAVQEMVTLLEAVRAYEMLQKVVQAEDELNQTAINQVGAVG